MKNLKTWLVLMLSATVLETRAENPTYPSWWDDFVFRDGNDNPVTVEFGIVENKKPAQIGQLKNFALGARNHLNNVLAEIGGAGPEIDQLISKWEQVVDPTKDANKLVNLGQVKFVASRFYNRLNRLTELGIAVTRDDGGDLVPWEAAAPLSADDFKVANVGQVKNCFYFKVELNSEDLDESEVGDGVPDYIERILGFDPEIRSSVRAAPQGGTESGDYLQYVRLQQDGMNYDPAVPIDSEIPAGFGLDPPVSQGGLHSDHLSRENAARFLCQAGWGPSKDEIERVRYLGFKKWIAEQLAIEFPTAPYPGASGQPEDGKFWFDYSLIEQKLEKDENGNNLPIPFHTEHPLQQDGFPRKYSFEAYVYYLEWIRNHAHRSNYMNRNANGALANGGASPFGKPHPNDNNPNGLPQWRYLESGSGPSPGRYFGWNDGQDQVRATYIWSESGRIWNGNWDPLRIENLYTAWMRRIVHDDDVLRQRVAWALSQIFVVSLRDADIPAYALASYYEMLNRRSLGNFRTLLKDVTLHPAMGRYLSHMYNEVADGSGRVPDENFAREIMQLFSIGLWDLNRDGTRKLKNRQPIPSYSNDDVKALARVFTGLGPDRNDDNSANGHWTPGGAKNGYLYYMARPMVMWDDHPTLKHRTYTNPGESAVSRHDYGEKKLFRGTNNERVLAATNDLNDEGHLDIDRAIDALVEHSNTAPFISRLLIQHLVTSNPSPAYVKRVADVFAGEVDVDGDGQIDDEVGHLGNVITTILLDEEARSHQNFLFDPNHGKLRAPMLRLAHLVKAFNAGKNYSRWSLEESGGDAAWEPASWSSAVLAANASRGQAPEIIDDPPTFLDLTTSNLTSKKEEYLRWRDVFSDYATKHGLDSCLQWYWSLNDLLHPRNDSGYRWRSIPAVDFGQMFLTSPTVFNFFLPGYRHPGQIARTWVHRDWVVSPEFEILDDVRAMRTTNRLWGSVDEPIDSYFAGQNYNEPAWWPTPGENPGSYSTRNGPIGGGHFQLQYDHLSGALDELNIFLANGRMRSETREILLGADKPASEVSQFFVKSLITSPEGAVLK